MNSTAFPIIGCGRYIASQSDLGFRECGKPVVPGAERCVEHLPHYLRWSLAMDDLADGRPEA